MASEPISVFNKIADVVVAEKSFTDDKGQKVNYQRLLVVVDFDGTSEEIEFTPSQGKLAYRLLQMADVQES